LSFTPVLPLFFCSELHLAAPLSELHAQCKPLIHLALKNLTTLEIIVNTYLQQWQPCQIFIITLFGTLLLSRLFTALTTLRRHIQDVGLTQIISGFILDLPIIRSNIQSQRETAITDLRADLKAKRQLLHNTAPSSPRLLLPHQGLPPSEVRHLLSKKTALDLRFIDGVTSHVSGTVYMSGQAHKKLLLDTYSMFMLTNPIHGDVWPSVQHLETEVVAMTASLFGAEYSDDDDFFENRTIEIKDKTNGTANGRAHKGMSSGKHGVLFGGDCSQICGAMTSGGTESILSAAKSSRDYMASIRGITQPEMVIAVSAHAAFIKASEYFKIRLIKVDVDPADYRLHAAAVRKAINKNTVLVVASSPGFPHGVMDCIEEIASVTRAAGIPLHVDACLGGFVLPFGRQDLRRLNIPKFDFSVPGVTSISVDTHKFGLAHKGTSVVLYRSPKLRKFQYTRITDWSGGLYISPGFAGSRSGALIATAWASLNHLGRRGLVELTRGIYEVTDKFKKGVQLVPHIEVVGEPEASVVAIKAIDDKVLDIYKVNDVLLKKGWHMNALQRPAALHFCFTAAHSVAGVEALLKELKSAVEVVLKERGGGNGNGEKWEGMAPLYGMAATVPDRRIVGDFLEAFQDAILDVR